MIWDSKKSQMTIEWIEKKGDKDEYHNMKKSPLRLQFHPKNGEVLRAHFKGVRPSWIIKYAKEKKYQTHETTAGAKGWWIANWSNYQSDECPLICPYIEGMIEEWFEKLPETCQADKKNLLNHLEVVEINLLYHAAEFNKWGLYFRPDDMLFEGGAMLLEDNLLPKLVEDTEFQVADWPDYMKVVRELQELRDIPETTEIKARIDDYEDEPFVLEIPPNQEIGVDDTEGMFVIETEEVFELKDEFSEDHELIVHHDEFDEHLGFPLPGDNDEQTEFEMFDYASEDKVVVLVGTKSEEIVTTQDESDSEEENLGSVADTLMEDVDELILIAKKPSKREGIVVGQTLLF